MDAALLSVLRVVGPIVLVVGAWSVWQRRLTFGSRWDVTGTVAVALFGVGAMLDSPWPGIAAVSFPVTGKYYVLTMIGHLCCLVGGAVGIKAVYTRLLPDDAIGPFMRMRVLPLIVGAAAVMMVCFAASSVTSTMSADHIYLVAPDGWMRVYLLIHFGTAAALGIICGYGVSQLREDPRSVMLNLFLLALALAALAGLLLGWGVITNRDETLRLLAWLAIFAAFICAAVVSAVQWRHRIRSLQETPGIEPG